MIPKTANKQLKTKEFVNEAIDEKEAKIPKAAKKKPAFKPSDEDTEAQSQKPASKTRIFLGIIFMVFVGIAAISTVAYFSYQDGRQNGYQDGRQNGIFSILKDPKARAMVEIVKFYSTSGNGYEINASENSEIEIVDDIMAIAMKYEDECKGSENYYMYKGAYSVVNHCFEKLKEKHYLVSLPYKFKFPNFTNTASATFLQL